MRVLCPIPSSFPQDGWLAESLRQIARRTSPWVEWEFATDDAPEFAHNRNLLQQWTHLNQMKLHISKHQHRSDYPDPVSIELPDILRARDWDAIELFGFTNAATCKICFDGQRDALLNVTPAFHTNAYEQISNDARGNVESIFDRVLKRADLVFAGSPHERAELQRRSQGRNNCMLLPHGVDVPVGPPVSTSQPLRLMAIDGPFAEATPLELLSELFQKIRLARPELQLAIATDNPARTSAQIPEPLRSAVELHEMAQSPELSSRCRGLIVLPQDAQHAPLALHALAAGVPVFVSPVPELTTVIGNLPLVRVCGAAEPSATAQLILQTLEEMESTTEPARATHTHLRHNLDWNALAWKRWSLVSTTWSRRRYWTCTN
jgi:hypothetical protein